MKDYLDRIYQLYNFLIPNRDEGLVVIWLNKKIIEKEIDNEFTYQDIQQAVRETSDHDFVYQPNTEKVLKNLMKYFIERPPDKPYHNYILSNYALRFVQLLDNKLRACLNLVSN